MSFTRTQSKGTVILMYHGTPLDNPTSQYSIRADKFLDHLHYFKKKDWHTATVCELVNGKELPNKTVAITFDDGFADNYQGAFLPLIENDMKATWFIATDCINSHAHWMGRKSQENRMLSQGQLQEMANQGMEIAAHTCSHPDLSTLSFAEQLAELKSSKAVLESFLPGKIKSFAYPYGKYNLDSIKAAELSGYRSACTVKPGWYKSEPNPFLIRRVTIFNTDSVSTLARKLVFADNYVSWNNISNYYWQRAKSRLF